MTKTILHLPVGYIGTGKTTLAKTLEKNTRAVRLNPDEWMIKLHGTNPPETLFRTYANRIMSLIEEFAIKLLKSGQDVILDSGLWQKEERDKWRVLAEQCGATARFYELCCPLETARQRTLNRTAHMPEGALVIDENAFDMLLKKFEPVDESEAVDIKIKSGLNTQNEGYRGTFVLVNGPINSGKSTIGCELSGMVQNSVFVEGDDHGHEFNGNIEDTIKAGQAFIYDKLKNTSARVLIVAYPVGGENYARLCKLCQQKNYRPMAVTLAPPLSVALSNRGERKLDDWERGRIKEMYAEGYTQRDFSDVVLDNSKMTAKEAARIIADLL